MAQASGLNRSYKKAESLRRLNRVVVYMVIYPVVYLILSLPLAAGRMASEGNKFPSHKYFAGAGSMMASSGFVDVLVYTFTRKHLLLDTESSITDSRSANENNNKNNSDGDNLADTMNSFQAQVSITGGKIDGAGKGVRNPFAARGRRGLRRPPRDSLRSIEIPDGDEEDTELGDIGTNVPYGVYQETTIEVRHEPAETMSTKSEAESTEPVLHERGERSHH